MSKHEPSNPPDPFKENHRQGKLQSLVAEVERMGTREEKVTNVIMTCVCAALSAIALSSSWHSGAKWGVGLTSLAFTAAGVSAMFETKESKLREIRAKYGTDVLDQVIEQIAANRAEDLLMGESLTHRLRERTLQRVEERLQQMEAELLRESSDRPELTSGQLADVVSDRLPDESSPKSEDT